MGNTWVTDMRHFLEEGGELADLPEPAIALVVHLGAIVGWVSRLPTARFQPTNVPCRRRPGRRRCLGEIEARLEDPPGFIEWFCPFCRDGGFIEGWQGTLWDKSLKQ
jgi:hypothetical protein